MECIHWTPTKFSKLCSEHFENDCFHRLVGKTNLKQGAVPTLFTLRAVRPQQHPRTDFPSTSQVVRSQRSPQTDFPSPQAAVIGAKPGFTKECFEKVSHEAQKGPLLISLMVDEISIKKQADWDGKEVVGYCDLGHGILKDDCIAYAKHALVFLAVAVNRNWKLPLGYALIDGLDGTVRSNLVQQYLIKLKEAGADCISVTCDGTSCNLSMLSALGVSLAEPRMKSWFPHPSDPSRRVYAILEACHMLKLMRNLLAEKELISDGAGRTVAWHYIMCLDRLQQKEGLHAGNKLRWRHIDFHQQKMKVSLAAQTLSRSVSCALLFCKEKQIPGFEGVEATAEFAAVVDDTFDLTNSCHPLALGHRSAF
ncbi:hypothetical protein HPB47_021012 [Ixodes persulcatus]|uniref:Uncharacterized protein n=1 Tax=Ixodes persulcatus TaxID=34615 RepID=A0AC60QDS7_IXOPE|nr:hypothetical protein HPB47_021012 [Ixodes persulcatus]